MKYFFLLLLLVTKLQAQDTVLVHSKILIADTMSKSNIYEKVKMWSVSSFKYTSGALQLDDKESGLLAYDASASWVSPAAPANMKPGYKSLQYRHKYFFKMQIRIRDGRYKVDFTDVKYESINGEQYVLTNNAKAPFKFLFSKQEKADKEWADAKLTFDNFFDAMTKSMEMFVNQKDSW